MHRLQDQYLEHQHVIERRAPTLRAIGTRHRRFQVGAKHLEVDQRLDPLQIISGGAKFGHGSGGIVPLRAA